MPLAGAYKGLSGLAIFWTSFEPRLDIVGTSFEFNVYAACGAMLLLLFIDFEVVILTLDL